MSLRIFLLICGVLFSCFIQANTVLASCDLLPPCGAQIQYSTPHGAHLFWCPTPDAVKYRLILLDSVDVVIDTFYTEGAETQFTFSELPAGKYSTQLSSGCVATSGGEVTYGSIAVTLAFKAFVIIDGVVMDMSPTAGGEIGQMTTIAPGRMFNMGTVATDTMKFRIEIWDGNTQTASFVLGFLTDLGGICSDAVYCSSIFSATSYLSQNATIWADGVLITVSQWNRRGLFRLQASNLDGKVVKVFKP